MPKTVIQKLGKCQNNDLYIKREDLLPFSFGGNKARKAELFFQEIARGNYDCVVTYGSSSSNHCRVVANACCQRNMLCYIISPQEASEPTFNSQMMAVFGAEITTVLVEKVHDAIEDKLKSLREAGKNPYFIPGGGHGNIGTQAYVLCYEEIKSWEEENGIHFDYIFHASGTGTTQAGLVCGQLLHGDERKIVGISIARKNPRGRDVVCDSVREYLGNRASENQMQNAVCFLDDYTAGYGKEDGAVSETIQNVLRQYGIPLDMTYTGKAFTGMLDYSKTLKDKTILFIHTMSATSCS